MAKLFNKIRKQLVADKPSASRTTNYLKYAIGEIVLVVFGILMAFAFPQPLKEKQSSLLTIKNKTFG